MEGSESRETESKAERTRVAPDRAACGSGGGGKDGQTGGTESAEGQGARAMVPSGRHLRARGTGRPTLEPVFHQEY